VTVAVKERPILFSAPMVRAILAGAKTQTRRIVRGNPIPNMPCPYGQPGDRLWVRETWSVLFPQYVNDADEPTFWRADYTADELRDLALPKWRPSIHMPRARSRITLEVTEIRCERLRDITAADAMSEGIHEFKLGEFGSTFGYDPKGTPGPHCTDDPRDAYGILWEVINGSGSWQRNPWVWVISFRRVEP
jgi:hypothetical protein